MNIIRVNNIRLQANHGCMSEETAIGGDYLVNIEILTDFEKSALTDDLTDTIDYCVVYQIVKEEMAKPRKLIETVGRSIINSIKSTYHQATQTQVEIVKISPPIDGNVESVSIVIRD